MVKYKMKKKKSFITHVIEEKKAWLPSLYVFRFLYHCIYFVDEMQVIAPMERPQNLLCHGN